MTPVGDAWSSAGSALLSGDQEDAVLERHGIIPAAEARLAAQIRFGVNDRAIGGHAHAPVPSGDARSCAGAGERVQIEAAGMVVAEVDADGFTGGIGGEHTFEGVAGGLAPVFSRARVAALKTTAMPP